jgi:hypothetical protein
MEDMCKMRSLVRTLTLVDVVPFIVFLSHGGLQGTFLGTFVKLAQHQHYLFCCLMSPH